MRAHQLPRSATAAPHCKPPQAQPILGPGHGQTISGERYLQKLLGSEGRAENFYKKQRVRQLNQKMQDFLRRQNFFFLATANRAGDCDSSFRAGPPGFVQILNARTLIFPEYRGNGAFASAGNIVENPQAGLLFLDFVDSTLGLHINGTATLLQNTAPPPAVWADARRTDGRMPVLWVRIEIEEAYIHCKKHVPRMTPRFKRIHWGTDNVTAKGGDAFEVGK